MRDDPPIPQSPNLVAAADAEIGTPSRRRFGSAVAIFGALAVAGIAAVACGPKGDDNGEMECKYGCDESDSHIQCLLKIESGLIDEKLWEITCADTSDITKVAAACESACAQWEEQGTSRYCIETVKTSGIPQWQPFYCEGSAYGGTDGLPDPTGGGDGDGADESGSQAPAWEPGAYITYNANLDVYIIDQALVDAVKQQPTLLALDGSTLEERTSGGFEFKNVTSGSLAQILGLANGDVAQKINGHELATMQDAMNAMAAIYDASSITLKVSRSGTAVNLDYLIR